MERTRKFDNQGIHALEGFVKGLLVVTVEIHHLQGGVIIHAGGDAFSELHKRAHFDVSMVLEQRQNLYTRTKRL